MRSFVIGAAVVAILSTIGTAQAHPHHADAYYWPDTTGLLLIAAIGVAGIYVFARRWGRGVNLYCPAVPDRGLLRGRGRAM
ncbi:MAG: hypothetical protein GY798_04260 [Hyphomicrobiales bacterium]|nr:hypothetical protein [Hyphomicrobiales bacterium]